MFIPIDVSMYYNLQKLGMVNHVYLCPIYMHISVGVILFLTLGILLNVIVHIFLIFNENVVIALTLLI